MTAMYAGWQTAREMDDTHEQLRHWFSRSITARVTCAQQAYGGVDRCGAVTRWICADSANGGPAGTAEQSDR